MKPVAAEEMVLEGVVVPVAWGPTGEILGIDLMTFDEAVFHIDPEIPGNHCPSDYLRKRVRLSAVIRDDRVIRIRRIEVLGNAGHGS